MSGYKWTPEEIQFIKDNIAGRTYAELTEMFNRQFGRSATIDQMRHMMFRKYGLRNGLKNRYTPEEIQFIKDNIAGRTYAELTEMFNRRFGRSATIRALRNKCFNCGISHCRNIYPIGAERINHYGYVEVKIGKSKYERKLKHHIIWEAANGPIPKGHVVIFADGDKRNFILDNLLLVSHSELGIMNHQGLISTDKDLTKAGKVAADIYMAIADRERELGIRRIRRKKKADEQDGRTKADNRRHVRINSSGEEKAL
jgi:hypothetical protein